MSIVHRRSGIASEIQTYKTIKAQVNLYFWFESPPKAVLHAACVARLSETCGAEELAAVGTLAEGLEQAAVSTRRPREQLQEVLGSPPAYLSRYLLSIQTQRCKCHTVAVTKEETSYHCAYLASKTLLYI